MRLYFSTFFFAFSLLLFLVSMADPVWGLLPKAQDNPQLISEAIAEAIAEHEADPEAHLGEGESLESHRANEIIDHPAGSVVQDKFSAAQANATTVFSTLDGWDFIGSAYSLEFPGLVMLSTTSNGNSFVLYTPSDVPYTLDDMLSGLLFQTTLLFGSSTGKDYYVGLGDFFSGSSDGGIGFQLLSGVLWGYYSHNGVLSTVNLGSVPLATLLTLRAQCNSEEETIDFYVNGEVLGSLPFGDLPVSLANANPSLGGVKVSGSGQAILRVLSFTISKYL